jgi:hypothetical protein
MDPDAFRQYAERFLNEPHRSLPPDLALAQWFEANRSDLAKSPYVRQQNELVANLLLPLFEEIPEVWEAMAYLNPTSFHERFEDHLQAWHDNAPERTLSGTPCTSSGLKEKLWPPWRDIR